LVGGLSASAAAQSGGRQQTEIEYDERGRVREVRTVTSAQAPQVDGLAPARASRTTSVRMLAQGRGLRGVAIAPDDPALTVSSVTATESSVSFRLHVGAAAALGSHSLAFTTALGSATAAVEVTPAPPALAVTPNPLVLGPGESAPLSIRFDTPGAQDHALRFASEPLGVVVIAPAQAMIAEGATEPAIQVIVTAVGSGGARIVTTLDESIEVFSNAFVAPRWTPAPGSNWSFVAPQVGVVVEQTAVAPVVSRRRESATVGVTIQSPPAAIPVPRAVASAVVGVSIAPVAYTVEPATVARGAMAAVVVHGEGMQGVDSVTVEPSAGVVVTSGPAPSPDGRSVSVQLSVAADAPATIRRIELRRSGTVVPFARIAGDRITVVN
jgi:hypothetical protein